MSRIAFVQQDQYDIVMPTIRLMARVDEQHRLLAEVPPSIAAGIVEVTIVIPELEEDDAGLQWERGVAREWSSELADPREDIYTLNDGEPIGQATESLRP